MAYKLNKITIRTNNSKEGIQNTVIIPVMKMEIMT